jgi:hypothetical protein
MAKGALFIGWGEAIPGREQQALKVFNDVLQYYGRLQQQGQIDSFEPFNLEPHGGDLEGFLLLRGDVGKLNAVRYSDEFLQFNNRAALVIRNLGIVMAFTGQELQQQFENFGKEAAAISQGGA